MRQLRQSLITGFTLLIAFAFTPGAHASDWSAALLAGVPHPLDLSIDKRLSPRWSGGFALGGLTIPLKGNSGAQVKLGISNAEFRGRWHPFDGVFYLGGILGGQTLSAKASQSIDLGGTLVPVSGSMKVSTIYFTPHLGWLRQFETGFQLGFDLGWQFPLHSKGSLAMGIDNPGLQSLLSAIQATSEYQDLQADVEDKASKIGQISFPYITVLRIGWAF
jgi:hypothetical protein